MTIRIVATDTGAPVPFFAALDACDKPCWTDNSSQALTFDTRHDAQEAGDVWFGDAGWKIEVVA